jgi:hypothetical protein
VSAPVNEEVTETPDDSSTEDAPKTEVEDEIKEDTEEKKG